MSRSFKRTPIIGHTTAESEKQDKRLANRSLRRQTREALRASGAGKPRNAVEGVAELPLKREVSNVYSFGKDGKQWLDDPDPKDLRK
jgi:hypothetical protein